MLALLTPEIALAGWAARIRTWEWRNQNPPILPLARCGLHRRNDPKLIRLGCRSSQLRRRLPRSYSSPLGITPVYSALPSSGRTWTLPHGDVRRLCAARRPLVCRLAGPSFPAGKHDDQVDGAPAARVVRRQVRLLTDNVPDASAVHSE